MSHVTSSLSGALLGALALAGVATAQSSPAAAPQGSRTFSSQTPVYAGRYLAATGQFIPANSQQQSGGVPDPVIYRNDYYTARFYDLNDGTVVYDEGRVPSPTSPGPLSGMEKTSYRITGMQVGYVTDSNVPVSMRLRMWHQYNTCTDPSTLGMPIADIAINNMPGTIQAGSFTPFTFDIDMTGIEFCLLAEGDGVYFDGASDRFGWSLEVTDGGDSTETGPIVAGRPGTPFAPVLDGTVFQNAGAVVGSGLGAEDQWYDVDPINGNNCFNWGGYDPIDGDPPPGSFWLVLRSDLSVECTGCQNGIDDGFEPNDTCLTAFPVMAPNVYTNLVVQDPDEDFYLITVPAGSGLTASVDFIHADADIDLTLRSADCNTVLDSSGSITNTEQVDFFNCSAVPVDVVLRVFVFGNTTRCGDYTMTLALDNACAADDLLEDNDNCAQAFPVSLGATPNLRIKPCDEDYFLLDADPGEMLSVGITNFPNATVDLDLFLFDAASMDCGVHATALASSTSVGPIELIQWTNSTGQVKQYVLKVDWFGGSVNCASYTLGYTRVPATEVGFQFCTAVPNSTGQGAHIFLTGSDILADNDITLHCRFLPNNSNGYFINSLTQVFVAQPGGSQGNLCIGGSAVGRYNGNVLNSGATDEVSLVIDLTMIPRPTGFVSATVGQTWNFQYWYRDANPGAVSNFSDAVGIKFL